MTDAGDTSLRNRLLTVALPHVPFDGWTERTIRSAAHESGVGIDQARALFPGGGLDLLALHSRNLDAEMAHRLSASDLEALRVRERIALAVRIRLELAESEREAARRAVTLLALPGNAITGGRLLYATVDAIWRAAGDRSTDWNFYSKRGLLAAVYASTVLFWLQDESQDRAATWAFLERRIADVMAIPGTNARLRHLFVPRRRSARPQAPRL